MFPWLCGGMALATAPEVALEVPFEEVIVQWDSDVEYPDSEKGAGDVSCAVALSVDAAGHPTSVVADCDEPFAEVVASTLSGWRFRPHTVDDEGVPFTTRTSIEVLDPDVPLYERVDYAEVVFAVGTFSTVDDLAPAALAIRARGVLGFYTTSTILFGASLDYGFSPTLMDGVNAELILGVAAVTGPDARLSIQSGFGFANGGIVQPDMQIAGEMHGFVPLKLSAAVTLGSSVALIGRGGVELFLLPHPDMPTPDLWTPTATLGIGIGAQEKRGIGGGRLEATWRRDYAVDTLMLVLGVGI